MANTTQGFAALLNVYVRQYHAQVQAELTRVKCNYRTVDNIAMIDKDIAALAQVCTQADKILIQGDDNPSTSYAQARMISMLIGANASALKTHLPMVAAADLNYITGPNVAVLDQARLKASAKRLIEIDDAFLANVDSTVSAVQKALTATFPKPEPQPDAPPVPDPTPMPVPVPDPEPDPEPEPEPEPDPEPIEEPKIEPLDELEEGWEPTGPADMFDTPPSPLDASFPSGPPNVPEWSDNNEHLDLFPDAPDAGDWVD